MYMQGNEIMNEREERRHRLREGLRRKKGERLRPRWIAAIREACGVDVGDEDFLPLEETERVTQIWVSHLVYLRDELRQALFWLPDDVHSLDTILHDLGRTLGPRPIILFTIDDFYTGAIRLPADRVFTNSARMRALRGGHLDLIAEDLQHGLGITLTYHDANDDFARNRC